MSELQLALEAVRAINAAATYLRARGVANRRLAEAMDRADAEGRPFSVDDLEPLVDARIEARENLRAEIARQRG